MGSGFCLYLERILIQAGLHRCLHILRSRSHGPFVFGVRRLLKTLDLLLGAASRKFRSGHRPLKSLFGKAGFACALTQKSLVRGRHFLHLMYFCCYGRSGGRRACWFPTNANICRSVGVRTQNRWRFAFSVHFVAVALHALSRGLNNRP